MVVRGVPEIMAVEHHRIKMSIMIMVDVVLWHHLRHGMRGRMKEIIIMKMIILILIIATIEVVVVVVDILMVVGW